MKRKKYSSPEFDLVQLEFDRIMADTVRDSYQEDFNDDIDDRD